jgi:predicted dehydrogenase
MTSNAPAIGLGLIGFGYWGPNLLRNFSATPGVCVKAVCDVDARRLAAAQAAAPWLAVTGDVHKVLAHPGIGAVAIATPVASHFEIANAALAAGKHVFIEKPLARTSDEAMHLIGAAKARGCVLMVDHTYVYSSAVERLRALIERDELGQAFYYDSVRANLGRFRDDVDVLWDLAVHDLAILDFLFDAMPTEVTATGANFIEQAAPRASDLAYLTLRYADGLLAHIHVNWLSPIKIRRAMIGASRRMVVYDDLEPSDKLKIYDRGVDLDVAPNEVPASAAVLLEARQRRIGYRTGDMWAPRIDVVEPLATACAEFARCIRDGSTPRTDGTRGQRVVRVLEAASASLAERGTPVGVAPR